MKPYLQFANIYDDLMEHVDYDRWLTYMEKALKERGIRATTILDIGCGTGEFMMRMNQAGYTVAGLDLSEDMLTVAHQKLQSAGYPAQVFHEDMSQFSGLGRYDVITIFCDSLNYIKEEEAFKQVFLRCYDALNNGGLLLFDVHSPFKMSQFDQATYADDGDGVAYIWHSFTGDAPNSVEHELTFFIEQENGLYERVEELHQERTFNEKTYTKWLEESGFKAIQVTSDFCDEPPHAKTERFFFSAIKEAGTS
ncbi:class I SAM-dependent methyltransferase [Shouchella sp. JSM 1781072]|uniref:class I SAM-dependent DNA methyltransferase n=1 Tax=Shouchella sp. JSM 1781072 TaxID=3344581 RepID=UPI0035BF1CD3